MGSSATFTAPPGFRDCPTRALAAGEVVASTYQIRDEVARTDTGLVYEARDMLLDRRVAFKLAWRDPGTPSLLPEARRCAMVRDPCAVAIHGMGTHNGVEYVVGERVGGMLLRATLGHALPADLYLQRLRALVAAVASAHEAGIAIGDISGGTALVDPSGRLVLGRLSLSQVPAFGRHDRILAPEVARGECEPHDPAAAEMIDLYNLGCVAIELARGSRPFADDDLDAELEGHAHEPPPRLADLRPDLPSETGDLVEWLLAKHPRARPRSAQEVLSELDAIIDRHGGAPRAIRVLVVDDDTARVRKLWSLARRAHSAVLVETASDGSDAAHKLNRDQPDLVFVTSQLRGMMNLLELCMYARGLEGGAKFELVAVGPVSERERAPLDAARVTFIPDDPHAFVDRVRATVTGPRRGRPSSRMISG